MTWAASPLRAAARLSAFVLLSIFMTVAYSACIGPLRRWRRPLQVVWSKGCYALAGIAVRSFGVPYRAGPAFTVANHVSYLDIPVLAALIDGTFVAKNEVGSWPLFGTAAKITGTVFVNRSGGEAMSQREELTRRLSEGNRGLILFAEGTSTDGGRVAPFKTSLFSIAERPPEGGELVVQPVSIAYPRDADGRPLTGARRELYCWYGDATLMPHLWRMMGLKGAEAEVRFHSPIRITGPVRRKDLAKAAEAAVAAGVAEAFASPEASPRIAAA
ncbi:MAG TPA: lysophospholipid acyltransferase family protein [Rhodospirillales bacterium]|nr:lysophospholipid acyltransferase family protein [Rhodospirillales bacterium]